MWSTSFWIANVRLSHELDEWIILHSWIVDRVVGFRCGVAGNIAREREVKRERFQLMHIRYAANCAPFVLACPKDGVDFSDMITRTEPADSSVPQRLG